MLIVAQLSINWREDTFAWGVGWWPVYLLPWLGFERFFVWVDNAGLVWRISLSLLTMSLS
jgi:hypothetical protein